MAFLRSMLVGSHDSAVYQGAVYTRWLDLRLSDERIISVFDPTPISSTLSVNREYDLVVAVGILVPATTEATNTHCHGRIVVRHWQPEGPFTQVSPSLASSSWAVLRLPVGDVLISSASIPEASECAIDLQWDRSRFDLLAVI